MPKENPTQTESAPDVLVRAIGVEGAVRAMAVRSTAVGEALRAAHGAAPTATVALTRAATAALLLGGTIKGREQVSIELKGDGPLRDVYAIDDAHGAVRARVGDPGVDRPPRADGRFDVGGAIGQGMLTITRSLGMKEPYRGVIPLVTGEIATDLARYFVTSEQKPAAVGLGERVDAQGVRAAGGFLVQAMPGSDERVLERIEARIEKLPPLSDLFAEGLGPEDLLRRILLDIVVLETYPVRFECPCSRDRFERILVGLGEAELSDIVNTQAVTELVCHFCNTRYFFRRDEIAALVEEARRH
jgi:molecular chaperone Hsp33